MVNRYETARYLASNGRTMLEDLAEFDFLWRVWCGNAPGYVDDPVEYICKMYEAGFGKLIEYFAEEAALPDDARRSVEEFLHSLKSSPDKFVWRLDKSGTEEYWRGMSDKAKAVLAALEGWEPPAGPPSP